MSDEPLVICGVDVAKLPEDVQVIDVILLVKGIDEDGLTYLIRSSDGMYPAESYGMARLFAERMMNQFLEEVDDDEDDEPL